MSDWQIGQVVRIPRVNPPMRQPHPEHEGKIGTITGSEPMSMGETTFDVPVITLEDGAVLKGYDCWWEPVRVEEN